MDIDKPAPRKGRLYKPIPAALAVSPRFVIELKERVAVQALRNRNVERI